MRKVKRYLSLLLVLVLTLSFFPLSVNAGNPMTISLRITSDSAGLIEVNKVAPDGVFFVWVDYEGNPTILNDTLCNYDIYLGYDSSLYTIATTPVQKDSSFGSGEVNTAKGTGVALFTWISTTGIYTYDPDNDINTYHSSGTLFGIRFKAKADIDNIKVSDFVLLGSGDYVTKFNSYSEQPISANTHNASITVYVPNQIAVTGGVSTVAVPTLAQNNGTTTTAPFTATVYGSTGDVELDKTVTWSVANKNTSGSVTGVTIDNTVGATNGAVTVTNAASGGTYVVSAVIDGYEMGTKEFTVIRADGVVTEVTALADKPTVNVPITGDPNATVKLSYTALDQFGSPIIGTNVAYSLVDEYKGVSISGDTVTITREAAVNSFTNKEFQITTKATVDGIDGIVNVTLTRNDSEVAELEFTDEDNFKTVSVGSYETNPINVVLETSAKDQYGQNMLSFPMPTYGIYTSPECSTSSIYSGNDITHFEGYIFKVSQTAADGTYYIKVSMGSAFDIFTVNITRDYAINVQGSNVTVTAVESETAPVEAKSGAVVSFTVTPEAGYEVANVAYKSVDSTDATDIENVDGTYSFTMPSSDVVIITAYKLAPPTVSISESEKVKTTIYGTPTTLTVNANHIVTSDLTYNWFTCDSNGLNQNPLSTTTVNTLSFPGTFNAGTHYVGCKVVAQDGNGTDTENSAFSSLITVTVNKAQLTPYVISVDTKPYDGTTDATDGKLGFIGAVNGDNPTASGTFMWTSPNAGTSTVNVTNIQLTGASTFNYTLSKTSIEGENANAVITKATYIGTAVTGIKTVFNGANGSADFALTNFTGLPDQGLVNPMINTVNADSGNKFITNVSKLTDSSGINFTYNATSDQDEDEITVTISSLNYEDITATLTVVARNIIFTEDNSYTIGHYVEALIEKNTTYGTSNSQLITGTLPSSINAMVGEDQVIGHFELKNPEAVQNAGTGSITIAYVIETTGYTNITLEQSFPITIGKAVLTPELVSIDSKPYDKDTAAAGVIRLNGWQNNDTPAENNDGTKRTHTFNWTSAAALTTTVKVENIELDTAWTANYELSTNEISMIAPNGAMISKREITVSGITVNSKEYNSSTDATLDYSKVTFTGLQTADNLSVTATGAFEDKNVGTDKNVNITGLTLSGTDAANYVLAATGQQSNAKANITPIEITISGITAADKVYDGNTTATLNTANVEFDGKYSSDALTVSATGTFDSADVGTRTVSISGLTLGGADAGNYVLAATGQQTQTTASITTYTTVVTFNNYTGLTYDGQPKVVTATYVDVNGETQNATVNYDKTPLAAGDYTATASTGNNYTLSGNTQAFTIAKLKLEITDPTLTESKVYDGKTDAAVTEGSLTNKVSSDTVTVTATAAYDNKNVGTGKTITVTYNIDESASTNYIKPDNYVAATGVINAKKLTIPNPTVTTTKFYDGGTNAEVTPGALIGVIDNEAVSVSAEATYNDKNTASNKTITVKYTLTGDNIVTANYAAPDDYTVEDGIISPLLLTITDPEITLTKIFDNDVKALVKVGSLTNQITTDDITVTASAAYDNKDVGTGKAITVVYTIDGADKDNYLSPIPYTINTGVITQKDASTGGFMVDAIADQTYTGSEIRPAVVVKFNSQLLTEDVDYTVDYAYNTEVGNNATATIKLIGNYKGTLSRTFKIVGRVLTNSEVEIGTITNQTYDGNAKTPSPTVTIKEGNKLLTKDTDYTLTYSNNINAGTAAVIVTFKGSYGGTATASFTIDKATPTVNNVSYEGSLYTSSKLPTLTCSPSVPGKIAFAEGTVLSETKTDYDWVFTPSDTLNYNLVTGTINMQVSAVKLASIKVSYTQSSVFYTTSNMSAIAGAIAADSKLIVTGMNNDGSSAGTLKSDEYTVAAAMDGSICVVTVTAASDSTIKGTFIITLTEPKLVSIKITTAPTKLSYIAGVKLERGPLVVMAVYDNGDEVDVTDGITESYKTGESFSVGDTYVTLSYTDENGVTKSVLQPVKVTAKEVTEFTVTGSLTYNSYVEGESIKLDGLTIKAKYNDGTDEDVSSLVKVTYYGNDSNEIAGNSFVATAAQTKVKLSYGDFNKIVDIDDPVKPVITWQVGPNYPVNDTSYFYGDTPEYIYTADSNADPNKYSTEGYFFAGWSDGSKDLNGVLIVYSKDDPLPIATKNVTYTATYIRKEFTVAFMDHTGTNYIQVDGNDTQTVKYGSAAKAPATVPERTGYTFIGWNDGVKTYTTLPVITSVPQAGMGELTVYPLAPPQIIIYTAQYSQNMVTVKYYNEDGTPLYIETVGYGADAVYGTQEVNHPTKQQTAQYSYKFDDWYAQQGGNIKAKLYSITADTTAYARFVTEATRTYTYTFVNEDGSPIAGINSVTAEYGTEIIKPNIIPSKAEDQQYKYTFAGFAGYTDGMKLTGDITFKATYTKTVKSYKVTWISGTGTTEEIYAYNAMPSFKGNTDKPADSLNNYEFIGWDKPITAVTGDVTYEAQYNITARAATKYTITFNNDDNTEITEQVVDAGKRPVAPAVSKAADPQYTYTFAGWLSSVDGKTYIMPPTASADAVYTAQYTKTERWYAVTFKDYDGGILLRENYKFGTPKSTLEAAASTLTPSIASSAAYEYTFTGWSPDITDVSSTATYKALFTQTAKKYTVIVNYVYENGTPVHDFNTETLNPAYGSQCTASIPELSGYTAYINGVPAFNNSYTITRITGDAEVNAVYIPNEYKLTVNFNMPNSPLQTQVETVDYNSEAYLAFPIIDGYELLINGTPYAAGTYIAEWQSGILSATRTAQSPGYAAVINLTHNIASDKTLNLTYEPKEFTVTYKITEQDGTVIDPSLYIIDTNQRNTDTDVIDGHYVYTQKYRYGEEIIVPNVYRPGTDTEFYTWSGWEGLPVNMPAMDFDVTGKFTTGRYTYNYIILDQFGNVINNNYYRQSSDNGLGGINNPGAPKGDGYEYGEWEPYGIQTMSDNIITLSMMQTLATPNLIITYTGVGVPDNTIVNYTIGGAPGTATVTGGKVTIPVPYGSAYTVTSPASTGYTASSVSVVGVMNSTSDKEETVSYAVNSYTLTVHYVYENNATAAPTARQTKTHSTTEQFSITSPTNVPGHTASTATVTAPATANSTQTVIYIPNTYTLNIYYKYSDGSEAATTVTRSYSYGESYSVDSPEITNYTADKSVIAGTITGNTNSTITETVTYSTGDYLITYNIAGENPIFKRYNAGDPINPANDVDTNRTGYTFIETGWSWDCGYIPTVMPEHDLVANGSFTKNSYMLMVTFDSNVADGTTVNYTIDNGAIQSATVASGKIEIMVTYQSTCVVTAPTVSGYTASEASISVTMGAAAENRSITYTRNSSGSDGGGSTTTAPSDTIKQTTNTVSSEKITDALKAKTGEVNIETSIGKVIFTAEDAAKIAEGKAELTVKTEAASVSFTAEGLGKLTEGIKTSDSLKVEVGIDTGAASGFKVVSDETVLASVNVSVYAADTKVTTGFGTLTITIPVGKSYAGKTVSILHIKDDGAYTVLTAVIDENGNAAVNVDSLSTFVAVQKTIKPVTNVFSDVKSGDWFEGYAQYVYDQGLMTGNTATNFAPQSTASRAMIVTVLWRMEGSPTGNADAGFKDLTQDWYKEAVNWAFANGITTGKSAEEFDPSAPVTREQLASFLYRYSKLKGYDISAGESDSISGYDDAAAVSGYAVAAVQWAKGSGIINGRSTTTLVPAGQSTRAELAAMLTRFAKTAE